MRRDLHLEVGGCYVEATVGLLQQDIGKNWQRMPALDDAGYRLQRFQKRVSWYLF